ncbi:outer membrane protein assembly factor BamB [Roseateles saccharophilus]|uniref:Outer membrane protein assembly factor BamB n=1 Tax=Roseateles saccharophilus TaxID=304 RepID=A0A4R3UJ02_ROSSA|nr:outer membrane protein assembly factor BamB [Roseateles saccharophilus]MDG0833809.1 outer membrane protein assembly factor BamB [Roseateles saccharophilus]TCU91565.1 Beta-barrel assembly machine subunit BamB [Roseateles saccharophilus]
MKRVVLISLLAASLSGCSVWNSWFGDSKNKPAVLETLTGSATGRVVWSSKGDNINFPLSIATPGDRFVVASSDGSVRALAAADGRELWRGEAGAKLLAGVGSDGRYAAVVNRDNELVVLDAGRVVWKKALPTPVVAAPLVAGERVFALTLDRQVLAFDALDGRKIWELKRPGEPLTLAKAGVLLAYKDTLIVGQGPRLAGVDPVKGNLRWEASVATPRGTNEVERLADLVGPAVRQGELICARAFQSSVGCVNAERGSAVWNRLVGGANGIGADEQVVVAGDASDRLSAWKLANGDLAWSADQFQLRKLSAPIVSAKQVLIGDFEGQVHLLDRDTGKTRSRIATDGSAVVTAALLGDTALFATKSGGLFAIKAE